MTLGSALWWKTKCTLPEVAEAQPAQEKVHFNPKERKRANYRLGCMIAKPMSTWARSMHGSNGRPMALRRKMAHTMEVSGSRPEVRTESSEVAALMSTGRPALAHRVGFPYGRQSWQQQRHWQEFHREKEGSSRQLAAERRRRQLDAL